MKKSFILISISFCFLLSFGIFGYSYIEGWSLAESLYMTIITITTTGYQEVRPLSFEGRMFTIILLCAGVCALAYTTHIIVHELLSIDTISLRRKKMKKQISKLNNHVIICGFGRMGKNICLELEHSGIAFVIVDKVEENFKNIPPHYYWLQGDATDDQLLIDAGIERAVTLASMVDSDADSLYLTLAGRSLNPDIKIISRASNDSAKRKLYRAGADQVVQPLLLSGQKVAQLLILGEDADPKEFDLEKSLCAEKRQTKDFPEWIGQSVNEVEAMVHQKILAVISETGDVFVRKEFDRVFNEKDTVLFAGADQSKRPPLKLVS